jgi:hypothetical protein
MTINEVRDRLHDAGLLAEFGLLRKGRVELEPEELVGVDIDHVPDGVHLLVRVALDPSERHINRYDARFYRDQGALTVELTGTFHDAAVHRGDVNVLYVQLFKEAITQHVRASNFRLLEGLPIEGMDYPAVSYALRLRARALDAALAEFLSFEDRLHRAVSLARTRVRPDEREQHEDREDLYDYPESTQEDSEAERRRQAH